MKISSEEAYVPGIFGIENTQKKVICMRLLIAEDEQFLSKALSAILRRNNYEVDVVYDGREALSFLESGSYDAAILDVMMPEMDGIEVLRRIRASGNRTPVLMLTAKAEVEDKVLGLDSGANDYLTKPFATPELLARLRAMTRSQGAQSTARMQLGNITLDQARFELSSPSGSCRLTNKEYQVMELLILNPGRLISSEQILEKVWGYDNSVEMNVVWSYISYLRRKLAGLNGNVRIRVFRNAGYTLEAIS